MARRRIVIIGSGNVATHLAGGFQAAGCHICAVYSRNLKHASRLADYFTDCLATNDLEALPSDADLYLIACSDSAVADIASAMPKVKGIVAHTSGSVPLEVLASASDSHAVLYPLQTFSRESKVDLQKVPFFTEASDNHTLDSIDSFGHMLSPHVQHADSNKRTTLHIAGVLSCNFVNFLWELTDNTLKRDGFTLDVVRPLIEATLEKAMDIGPHKAQTGPAKRGDINTINRHSSLLPPEAADIYKCLSEAIIKSHNE